MASARTSIVQLMPTIAEARSNLPELDTVTFAFDFSYRLAFFLTGYEMQRNSFLRFALLVEGVDKTARYWMECTGPTLSDEGQSGYVLTAFSVLSTTNDRAREESPCPLQGTVRAFFG